MNLRFKIVIILIAVFLIYGFVDFSIQRFIVFPSFQSLENEKAIKNSKRIVQAIQREIHHLDLFCYDWAAWDDTYEFVEVLSKDYMEANLVLSTFTGNSINLIYIYDIKGQVVWGEIHDLDTEKEIQLSNFPKDSLPQDHPLLNFTVDSKPLSEMSSSGIIMTDNGPMIVVSRPILNSNIEGPIKGAVTMGRFLNQSAIKALINQTEIDFKVYPVGTNSLTIEQKKILHQITDKLKFVIKTSGNNLQVYTTLSDINDRPAILIESYLPRDITEKGNSTIRYAIYSIFFAALIVVVVVLLLLQWAVLSPLTKLTDHTLDVVKTADFTKTFSIKSQDEIGNLATAFNTMTKNVYDTGQKQKLLINEKQNLIDELQDALNKIKTLEGFVPICSSCKKVRDDKGYWNQIESYIEKHSEALFSHSMCPDCSDKFYGNQEWYIKRKNNKKT